MIERVKDLRMASWPRLLCRVYTEIYIILFAMCVQYLSLCIYNICILIFTKLRVVLADSCLYWNTRETLCQVEKQNQQNDEGGNWNERQLLPKRNR